MFKKFIFALLLIMLLSQFAVPAASAAAAVIGNCPPGFTLEMVMDHDMHPHQHVGTDTDLNGDGFICMKPVTPEGKIHVHMDNNLP